MHYASFPGKQSHWVPIPCSWEEEETEWASSHYVSSCSKQGAVSNVSLHPTGLLPRDAKDTGARTFESEPLHEGTNRAKLETPE